MLFLLTGDVQIGKTRWLEKLCADLTAVGVCVAGVVAPGQWVPRAEGQLGGKHGFDGTGRFEKLGIDNVLLPQGKRITFARRRDLVQAGQAFAEGEQAKTAQLGWAISDEAIAQVNHHFARIAKLAGGRFPHTSSNAFAHQQAREKGRSRCRPPSIAVVQSPLRQVPPPRTSRPKRKRVKRVVPPAHSGRLVAKRRPATARPGLFLPPPQSRVGRSW